MANLQKHNARKPVIENGYCFTGNGYSKEAGHLFTVSVTKSGGERREYKAEFTKAEALEIMAEWMGTISREERKTVAAHLARIAKEKGEHEMRDSPASTRA